MIPEEVKTLPDIIEGLMEAVEMNDYEHAHSLADDYLILTIEHLIKDFDEDRKEIYERIIKLYDDVGKWYS